MPKFLEKYSKSLAILTLSAIIVLGNFTISKAQIEPDQPIPISSLTKKIVISEINWAGSAKSSDDEWVELFNNTQEDLSLEHFSISGLLNSNKALNLKGVIQAKSYFLISKLSNENGKSNLNILPDLIEPKLSLMNSRLNLQLFENEILIDEVDTKDQKPFAGNLSPRSSMERIDSEKDGNNIKNWKTSNSRQNLKTFNTQDCILDFSTPKSSFNEINSNINCKVEGTFDLFEGNNIFEASGHDTKVIDFETESICNTKTYCKIEIPITLLAGENEILHAYFGTKESSEEYQKIFLNKSSFDIAGNYSLVFGLNNGSSKKVGIKIFLVKNSKISIGKGKFLENENVQNKTFQSVNNINWANIFKFNSANSAKGFNGKLVDILESKEKLLIGKYSVNYKVRKIENFNSGDDLINLVGFDERGNKLFESIVDENDLLPNQWKTIPISYDLKTSQKVRIFIQYFGNHFGAQSDIEIGEISL